MTTCREVSRAAVAPRDSDGFPGAATSPATTPEGVLVDIRIQVLSGTLLSTAEGTQPHGLFITTSGRGVRRPAHSNHQTSDSAVTRFVRRTRPILVATYFGANGYKRPQPRGESAASAAGLTFTPNA